MPAFSTCFLKRLSAISKLYSSSLRYTPGNCLTSPASYFRTETGSSCGALSTRQEKTCYSTLSQIKSKYFSRYRGRLPRAPSTTGGSATLPQNPARAPFQKRQSREERPDQRPYKEILCENTRANLRKSPGLKFSGRKTGSMPLFSHNPASPRSSRKIVPSCFRRC